MNPPPDMIDQERADQEWARRARAGERAAFDQLMRRHKEALYRFIRRYVGGAGDAQDLLQEAFLAAWLGLPLYDPARAFGPWLRRIALNKCRDWGRRQKVRQLFLGRLAREPVAPTGSPAEEARARDLDRAIASLPARLKEPLLLTATMGLSHQEAGETLGLSGKAVEMRLYRARMLLREKMRGMAGPDA